MNANRPELDAISNTVANALGSGFLEQVYEYAPSSGFWTCKQRTAITDHSALFAFIRGHLRAFALPSFFTRPVPPLPPLHARDRNLL